MMMVAYCHPPCGTVISGSEVGIAQKVSDHIRECSA